MSSTNVDLGNVEYLYLDNSTCNNGTGGAGASSFTWVMPYITPRESPIMFIQATQVLIDYTGNGKVGNADIQQLRYTNIFGQNYYTTNSARVASMLEITSTPAGAEDHYKSLPESPMVQVPTSLSELSFTINNCKNGVVHTLGDNGSICILLKIVRPKQMEIMNNTLASYVRTMP